MNFKKIKKEECEHKYELVDTYSGRSAYGVYHSEIIKILQCKKCGDKKNYEI